MDDEIIQQMGLLLTQMRVTRLSLESIERSTSRFTGLALLGSGSGVGGSGGGPFAPPPLLDGALKVYVVNPGDFVAPAGGGFGETILGGLGRFLGGLLGGTVGGVLGGLQIGTVLDRLARTVESLERTVQLLVTNVGLRPDEWRRLLGLNAAGTERASPPPDRPSPLALSLAGVLDRIPTDQLVTIVALATRAVDGLVLLVPLATGALGTLLAGVGDLRVEIVGWMSFALRNLLLLRAVAVAVLVDTASLVTPIATTVLATLTRLVDLVLRGATSLLADAVGTAFTTARVLARGLTASVNTAIGFVVGTVLPLLNFVQQTPLVRLFAWFVTALPAMLGALAAAAGSPLSRSDNDNLAALSASGAAFLSAPLPDAPRTTSLDASLVLGALDPAAQRAVVDEITRLGASTRSAVAPVLGEVERAVTTTASDLRGLAGRANTTFATTLTSEIATARQQSAELAAAVGGSAGQGQRSQSPTLDQIATSFRTWLTGGGLALLMGEMTRYFATAPAPPGSLPNRVLQGFVDAEGRHDVVIEVGEVVIDVTGPAPAGPAAAATPPDGPTTTLLGLEARARGGTVDDLLPVGALE